MGRSKSQKQLRFSSPGAVARAKLRASGRRERKRRAREFAARRESEVRASNRELLRQALANRKPLPAHEEQHGLP